MSKIDDEAVERNASEAPPRSREERNREWIGRGLLGLLIVGAAVGIVMYVLSGRYETTDNAFVQADKVYISAEVQGRAVEVVAKTNSIVRAGDLLFRIDDRAYRIALAEAEASVAAKRNEIEALRASYQEKIAELTTAKENTAFAVREFDRQNTLLERGFVARQKFDEAQHDLALAKSRESEIAQELASIRARLGGGPDLPVDQNPEVLKAEAAVEQARLNLQHTTILVPEDAIVAAVSLQAGEYVTPGKPLISLVSTGGIWITANFKETDLSHVQVGQRATITFDIYPDEVWEASVGSISPATGSEFALIPPQNASGNWVKVVQRVPVRLYLKDYTGDPPLPTGLSAQVEIDTEHRDRIVTFLADLI